MPAASGASGPTTVRWTPSRAANAAIERTSVSGTFSSPGSVAVPPLPGATNTFCTRGLCASFHASACSRPPDPTTSSFMSVPEMPCAGEYHCDAAFVGCADDFVVAQAAAGLDDGRRTRVDHHVEAIAKREEGVRGRAAAREAQTRVGGFYR